MLHQRQVVQQHTSDPVNVGNMSEISVDGYLQPLTVHSAGAASMLKDSQWYDLVCLLSMTVILTSVPDFLTELNWFSDICMRLF